MSPIGVSYTIVGDSTFGQADQPRKVGRESHEFSWKFGTGGKYAKENKTTAHGRDAG
jgi:hypothetical protein